MKFCITRMFLTVLAASALLPAIAAESVPSREVGKQIALDRSKGNCLACHAMPGIPENVQPGNFGPPLIAMKARFPSLDLLRKRVWDETIFNQNTTMPPFGKHKILTENEIDHVVEFIHAL
jgi:L-cysteine S-thiosulfotransferase